MKRPFCDDFMIDNKPMLAPDNAVGLSCADIDDGSTGMDESGFTHRAVLRHDVKQWDFTYSILTADEYKYLKSLLKGKAVFEFSFLNEDGAVEKTMAYSKSTSVTYFSKRHGLYKNFSFSVFEC